MDLVPVVDIGSPTATSLDALDAACADHGFFLLEGHGLDSLIDRTWATTRDFFEGDRERKESVRRDATNPLGYYDRELTKRRRDHKEVFDFVDPMRAADADPNRWPDGWPAFKSTMGEHFAAFADLGYRTLELVHQSLGLTPELATDMAGTHQTSSVRLNHYTLEDPVGADERSGLAALGDVALGHHTDPGVLTLLLQDDTGGLQAASHEHGWIDVEPRPGTIVVNLGDATQVWTNDRYRAAVHRVLPMRASDRYSIPYFMNPRRDAILEPNPALADGSPRYRSFTWKELMQGRADDNFADAGSDDIQIANYAIQN